MSFINSKPDFSNKENRKTKKVPKSETDVNEIVRRYLKTGQLPQNFKQSTFMDVSEIGDLREGLERVIRLRKNLKEAEDELAQKTDSKESATGDRPGGGDGGAPPTVVGDESGESAGGEQHRPGAGGSDSKNRPKKQGRLAENA